MTSSQLSPCIIVRKCDMCDEILEEYHSDYNSMSSQDTAPLEHQCKVLYKTEDGNTHSVLGNSRLIGIVMLKKENYC